MGGAAGDEPVAMTKRRARMRRAPTSTSRGPVKAGRALDHIHAQALETFDRVIGSDGGDDAMNVIVDPDEIYLGLVAVDAEAPGMTYLSSRVGSSNEHLGWDAAGVQAIATHLALFYQDNLDPHLGRAGGDGKAARARPDDAKVRFRLVSHRLFLCQLQKAGRSTRYHDAVVRSRVERAGIEVVAFFEFDHVVLGGAGG